MPLPLGINIGDCIEGSPIQITCEQPNNVLEGCSSGRKRKIKDVPYGEDVVSEADISVSVSPVEKAVRRSSRPLNSVLSKRYKQAEERSHDNEEFSFPHYCPYLLGLYL